MPYIQYTPTAILILYNIIHRLQQQSHTGLPRGGGVQVTGRGE